MKIKKELIYFMLVVITISIMVSNFYRRGISSDPCVTHKELFASEINYGIVAKKFIDNKNHAMKTVVIRVNDKSYELYFFPFENWPDFEKIKEGDIISKSRRSFLFKLNNKDEFRLKLECPYTRNDTIMK